MEKWRLWVCSKCKSEMRINKVATKEDYERFKGCTCGSELEYKTDLSGER